MHARRRAGHAVDLFPRGRAIEHGESAQVELTPGAWLPRLRAVDDDDVACGFRLLQRRGGFVVAIEPGGPVADGPTGAVHHFRAARRDRGRRPCRGRRRNSKRGVSNSFIGISCSLPSLDRPRRWSRGHGVRAPRRQPQSPTAVTPKCRPVTGMYTRCQFYENKHRTTIIDLERLWSDAWLQSGPSRLWVIYLRFERRSFRFAGAKRGDK